MVEISHIHIISISQAYDGAQRTIGHRVAITRDFSSTSGAREQSQKYVFNTNSINLKFAGGHIKYKTTKIFIISL